MPRFIVDTDKMTVTPFGRDVSIDPPPPVDNINHDLQPAFATPADALVGGATMPTTGHVLSPVLPGEGLMGYIQRQMVLADGTQARYQSIGAAFGGYGVNLNSFADVTNQNNWPYIADRFYNPVAYGDDSGHGDDGFKTPGH